MAKVHIDLQEGFDRDAVVIRLAARDAWRSQAVTTHRMSGLAEQLALDAPDDPGPHEVEVQLPDRKVVGRYRLDAKAAPYLGVSIEGDRVKFIARRKSFGYA